MTLYPDWYLAFSVVITVIVLIVCLIVYLRADR
jgi:predicted signal transduction protein with EAL and GGDEF domain